jgi:hypothetical protein
VEPRGRGGRIDREASIEAFDRLPGFAHAQERCPKEFLHGRILALDLEHSAIGLDRLRESAGLVQGDRVLEQVWLL